ncbi:MAG TPA: hypothetical protein VGL06_09085 [Pseudonocardiaceae bacterium]
MEAGRVRRSLTRALLVLGGVAVATVLGWLLGSASASAAELPSVPVVPSAVVSSVVPTVTLPAILPAAPALPATPKLPTPSLPSAPPDLGQVAQQVHLAVAGDDRVVPAVLPVAVLVPSAPVSPVSAPAIATAGPAGQGIVRQFVLPLRQHRQVASGGGQRSGGHRATSAPRVPAHPLPPLQPASPSDAGAHGSGGPAGGTGSAYLPFVNILGAAPNAVGTSNSPRLPVAPGHQPGTSPD